MDILVTGGAGFIGGHLAKTFAEGGHNIIVLDNFEPYYDLGIKEHNVEVDQSAAAASDGSYKLVRGSTTDAALVDDHLVSQVDIV
jgi:UDP-glucose 4-epimerase